MPHAFYAARGRRLFQEAERRRQATEAARLESVYRLCRPNAQFHERHRGERCFILGNGPSANRLDLDGLSGEAVFTVSNGYLHPKLEVIRPRYHCLPQVASRTTDDDVSKWFREMHERLGAARLFLSSAEEPLVRERGLFPGRTVSYLALTESFDVLPSRDIIDICRPVPSVESVPVMCLMIAMYMGFRKIYLLGIDHDHFKTGEYRYAFDITVMKNKDHTVSDSGKILSSRHDDFQSLARLWRQYRVLREIAEANGIRIYNATEGGELDEFPRVSFQEALRRPSPILRT